MEYPWKIKWTDRSKIIAGLIPKGTSVIDVGGGLGELKKFIPDSRYISIDTNKWTRDTVVADLNKEFPEISKADVVVCQGVIEYIKDPDTFLCNMKQYSNRMIISYRQVGENIKTPIKRYYLRHSDIKNFLKKNKWIIKETLDSISSNEKIYSCVVES